MAAPGREVIHFKYHNVTTETEMLTAGSKSGHRKVTRQRKEIFPGYEKIVLERSKMAEGQLEEAEEDGSGSSGDGDADDNPVGRNPSQVNQVYNVYYILGNTGDRASSRAAIPAFTGHYLHSKAV